MRLARRFSTLPASFYALLSMALVMPSSQRMFLLLLLWITTCTVLVFIEPPLDPRVCEIFRDACR